MLQASMGDHHLFFHESSAVSIRFRIRESTGNPASPSSLIILVIEEDLPDESDGCPFLGNSGKKAD
jgi:hypothetical protein